MKIYIMSDIEGVTGINSLEYTRVDGRLYGTGMRLLTQDVNAAVRGAFDGGADEVIVADGHGGRNNILVEDLDPRAQLLAVWPRQPRWPFLDESVDGVFLVGYHAMAGALYATRCHTMNGFKYHRYAVNGKAYGEVGIDAELAAECGVPVVMVSGDDKLCEEAQGWLGNVEAAMVKQGVSCSSTLSLSPARGQEVIYNHAKRAVERLAAGEKFFLPEILSPVTVAITYHKPSDADEACSYGAKRVDGCTVERTYDRLSDAYGGIWKDYGIEKKI